MNTAITAFDGFVMVSEDKEFKFKNLCPYCKGNLTYRPYGWETDDNGLWMAVSFDVDCSTEPDMEEEEEWDYWFQNHSEMPYVIQMPVDEGVKKYINRKYRFNLKS
ncbi:MAG: hypothetical protein KF852_04245 [Saprospiraceae bacterium]|nr:hypothetical protein [Saprospiraceae bacterium]